MVSPESYVSTTGATDVVLAMVDWMAVAVSAGENGPNGSVEILSLGYYPA